MARGIRARTLRGVAASACIWAAWAGGPGAARAQAPESDTAAPEGADALAQESPQQEESPGRPTPAEIAEAREAFGIGETLFQEGDYQGAADLFREAYRAVPDPTILFRIGDALQRAEDYRGAGEAYEEYLRRRSDAPDRADVEARLEGIRQVPGLVAVTSSPEGATVTVDGEAYEGVTPLEIQVTPGAHLVTATLEGYAPSFEEVEVGYDQRVEIELALEPSSEEPEDATGAAGPPVVPPATAGGAPVEPPEFEPSAGVWVATGLSAAALATGTVFAFLALDRQSAFDDVPSQDAKREGEDFALVADISFGVAAAAGITAIVLYFAEERVFDAGAEEDAAAEGSAGLDVMVTPAVGRHGGGVAARMRF